VGELGGQALSLSQTQPERRHTNPPPREPTTHVEEISGWVQDWANGLLGRGMSFHWWGENLSWCVRLSGTNKIQLGSPPHTALTLEPNHLRLNSLILWSCPWREALGGCGDNHKPPAECLCVGVLPIEQEGHHTAAQITRPSWSLWMMSWRGCHLGTSLLLF